MDFSSPTVRRRAPLFSTRTSVLLIIALAVVAGTWIFFYLRSRAIIDRLVKDRLRNEAAIAALQFTGEELDAIRTPADMSSPQFGELVWRLNDIRARTPGIRFAYIMRKTADPLTLEFVVDADALSTVEQLDRNQNGVVDPFEAPGLPGEPYSIAEVPALQGPAFAGPATDEDITTDQWGHSLSGYAPIRTLSGATIAVLGIDMLAEDYAASLQSIFSLQSLFLVLFGGMVLAAAAVWATVRHRLLILHHLDDERRWLLQLILHQVGTPLTIFKWGAESLREMLPHLPEAVRKEATENILIMEDGVSRLEHVAEVLLAADRIQEGSMSVTPESVSLKSVMEETVAGVAPQLRSRGQRVQVILPVDCTLMLDRRLLSGVLRELLDNAIIYSPKGGVITLQASRTNHHMEVAVADHGVGISREDLTRIFERFSRGSNAGKYDPNGTGVGLYIARGIVERFGGRITAQSDEGKGTTVTFTLPVAS